MNKKTERKLRWAMIREYLPSFKRTMTDKKGSPTLEYIIIIAAGATLAMLLVGLLDNNTEITNELKSKVMKSIKGEKEDGGDDGGDN